MSTVITSKQWRLNAYDFGKALIIAALSQPVTIILTSLSAGQFNINWNAMGIMAIGSAASYLLKNLFTPSQTVSTPPKVIIFLLCMGAAFGVQAQSMFKPLPAYQAPSGAHHANIAIAGGPPATVSGTWSGLRFDGPTVLFAVPDFTVYTGAGLAWESDVADATGKWYTNFKISIDGFEGGQFAPSSVSAVTAVGIKVSFFNGVLAVGALYNFTNRGFQGAIGDPGALIPKTN